MADKVLTITQPADITRVTMSVRRIGATTEMVFVYQPPVVGGVMPPTDQAVVLDSELTGAQQTNLNASLLAAYNIAKTKMGY